MTIAAAGLSDIGTRRESNQDSLDWCIAADGQSALAVVADGMGGYAGGEVASRIAVDTLMQMLAPALNRVSDAQIPGTIQRAVTLANERINSERSHQSRHSSMGTTVVLVWLQNGCAWIAHVGDSRCYLLHRHHLTQQTRDDTVAQSMVDDGSITAEEAARVPFRNVLTRALGTAGEIEATITSVPLVPGDRLILCSDGLTGAVPDCDWTALMPADQPLTVQAERLISAGLANQAEDNVSVIVLQFSSPEE